MKSDELLQKGRTLSLEQRNLALRKLSQREEFPALIAWLEDYFKKEFVEAFSRQELASHHGCLEHCAGSVHAIVKLQEELNQFALSAQK